MALIAAKELGKTIPVLGGFISAHREIFGAIEMNRIRVAFEEVFRRLAQLEGGDVTTGCDERSYSVLLYGADQVRGDLLAEFKAKEYGAAIAHYMKQPDDLNEVVEVLECLRKLNSGDLQVLYSFYIGGEVVDSRAVKELAAYQEHVDPFESLAAVQGRMRRLYPSLMRLQGIGVIYLSHPDSPAGTILFEKGAFAEDLQKFAFLTEAGRKLVAVLPK